MMVEMVVVVLLSCLEVVELDEAYLVLEEMPDLCYEG